MDRRLCSFSFWQKRLWRTCQLLSLWTEVTLFFQQAKYVQVFPLIPAPFYKLFAGLGCINNSAISLLFSSYLTLALSSPPCLFLRLSFYLNLSGRNCLLCPPVLSGYNGSQDTRFSRRTTRLISWPDGERYSCSAVLCILSPLISRIHSYLSYLAVSSLVYTATGTAYCCALISLGLTESRILPAAHADTRPRTPLISFCTVQLRTLCATCSLATLYLSMTSRPGAGELPGFWGSMVFCHAPVLQKGSDSNNNNNIYLS